MAAKLHIIGKHIIAKMFVKSVTIMNYVIKMWLVTFISHVIKMTTVVSTLSRLVKRVMQWQILKNVESFTTQIFAMKRGIKTLHEKLKIFGPFCDLSLQQKFQHRFKRIGVMRI